MTGHEQDLIGSDPEVLHGQLRIRGTRIPVSLVLDCFADGMTEDEILEQYPTLTVAGIRASVAWAADLARDSVVTDSPMREDRVDVALPADIHQIDETGYVWSVLEEASDLDRIAEGRVIVAGDQEEPFLARVVDIVDGAGDTHIVHLEVVGLPGQVIDELTRAKLLPT